MYDRQRPAHGQARYNNMPWLLIGVVPPSRPSELRRRTEQQEPSMDEGDHDAPHMFELDGRTCLGRCHWSTQV
ncbi:hypothetical protein VPH35_070115 [Triticum aestivum]